MSEPFIFCESLVKVYRIGGLEVQALQGLDLIVEPNELLGVVGSSGSGKSTLLNILGGIDRPTAGGVWVDGLDLLKMSDRDLDRYRRSTVGFVWQQGSRNLIPYLTAQENVMLPMTIAGETGSWVRARAEQLLEIVELKERRHHRLVQLSGGEQQRVAIAVALANEPHLLLADEPTGEVDSATAASLYAAFQNLNREMGITTLIVSHDPTIARHVDRVVAVRDGKLATETVRRTVQTGEDGEVHELYQEVIMLDSAGRLQMPKDVLQRYGIHRRAQLELTEQGILVRPLADGEQSPTSTGENGARTRMNTEEDESPAERLERLLRRFRKGSRR